MTKIGGVEVSCIEMRKNFGEDILWRLVLSRLVRATWAGRLFQHDQEVFDIVRYILYTLLPDEIVWTNAGQDLFFFVVCCFTWCSPENWDVYTITLYIIKVIGKSPFRCYKKRRFSKLPNTPICDHSQCKHSHRVNHCPNWYSAWNSMDIHFLCFAEIEPWRRFQVSNFPLHILHSKHGKTH